MKKEEKSVEGPSGKQENLGKKLKREWRKGGYTTPVIPFWRLEQQHHHHEQQQQQRQKQQILEAGPDGVKDSIIQHTPLYIPCVSSRKLAATFWELYHYKLPISKMHHQGGGGPPPPGLRRVHHQLHHNSHRHLNHSLYEDERGGVDVVEPFDPSPSSPDLLGSASSLRRHVAASIMKHHGAIERNKHAIQPVSLASYGSSMEMAAYDPAVTPSSSVDLKGRIGEASYSLKTSSELLKVLNRIWSLEEQHASNMSLIKSLRKELDHARIHVKELMRDKQGDRREIDKLMKQIAEDKLVRKNKEQDRISTAIQSVRNELQDERKLRRRSESLHRRLARELDEVKAYLATTMKELGKERKSRMLLEDLCDEFAWGIKDYEQELHALRQKFDKSWAERADYDRLILHVSESWLDERVQMKQVAPDGVGNRTSVLDKLSSDLETFLQFKQKGKKKNTGTEVPRDANFRRSSLESIPLNVAVSAPRDEDDDNNSAGSDSHCLEIHKPSALDLEPQENKAKDNHIDERGKPGTVKTNIRPPGKAKERTTSSWQLRFEENMPRAVLQSESREGPPVEELISKRSLMREATGCGSSEKNKAEANHGLSSNFVINNLIRRHYMSESGSMQPDNGKGFDSGCSSVWRSQPSPVRQWTDELQSHDLDDESSSRLLPNLKEEHDTESSSRLPPDLKENTLKAKLMEARSSKGQRSRSRLKGSKISL